MAPTAPGGRSPAISPGELLYATLLKFGLAEGEYRADPADGLRLKGAVILNAVKCLPPANKPEPSEIATCRNYFEAALVALPKVRVLVALGQIAHVAAARALGLPPTSTKFGHGAEAVAPGRPRPAVELSLLALQPEHRAAGRRDVRERVRAGGLSYVGRIAEAASFTSFSRALARPDA